MTADLPRVRIIDVPPPGLPEGVTLGGLLVLPPYRDQPGEGFREVRIPLWCERQFMETLWRKHKRALRLRGFTVKKHNNAWFLQQYLHGAPGRWTLTPKGVELLAALDAQQPELILQEVPAEFVLPELPHGLEAYLYEYQRQPARQLLRALVNGQEEYGYPGAWDCSDMGTGKTYQALAAAVATGLNVGVVCPKSVIGSRQKGAESGWLGAFKHFGQQEKFVLNYEGLRTGSKEWVKLRKDINKFEWQIDPAHDMLIFDEAHNCKNNSLNRKLLQGALRQGFKIICVSGTMAATPLNLGATGTVVGLHGGNKEGYERFLREHGCKTKGGSWYFDRPNGRHHLKRINETVFPRRGCRVSKEELGDLFPKNQVLAQAVRTEEIAALVAAYKAAEEMIRMMREQGMSGFALEAIKQKQYMAVRRKSELAKIPAIVELVEQEIEDGRSVAIFLNFTEAREKLQKLLKCDCAIFGGQDTGGDSRNRNEAIRRFQSDESRVIVVMSQAGGTGVSLHDIRGEHPRTALISPDNNAVTLGQVLGRIHRADGRSMSRQIILFAAGTVEEGICANVRRKLKDITTVNDGDLDPDSAF